MHWTVVGGLACQCCSQEWPTVENAKMYDALFITGSHYSSIDDSVPWIPKLSEILAQYAEAGVRMVGGCFGCQVGVPASSSSGIFWCHLSLLGPVMRATRHGMCQTRMGTVLHLETTSHESFSRFSGFLEVWCHFLIPKALLDEHRKKILDCCYLDSQGCAQKPVTAWDLWLCMIAAASVDGSKMVGLNLSCLLDPCPTEPSVSTGMRCADEIVRFLVVLICTDPCKSPRWQGWQKPLWEIRSERCVRQNRRCDLTPVNLCTVAALYNGHLETWPPSGCLLVGQASACGHQKRCWFNNDHFLHRAVGYWNLTSRYSGKRQAVEPGGFIALRWLHS